MEVVGELGALAMVHAENGDVVAQMQAKLLAAGNNGPEAHAYSRPAEVEGEATNRAIMIADMAGVPLYVVHTSCEESHEAIRRARMQGKRVYGEPLIQHLTLDESEYFDKDWDHAARRVMSPPFRNKKHQDSLWAGLASGSLSCVATDHCAFTTAQKLAGRDNFTAIPGGIPGVETRGELIYTFGVAKKKIGLGTMCRVLAENPAKLYGLYPRKGVLAPGSDADIVVYDPKADHVIRAEDMAGAADYNPYEGFVTKGSIRQVWLRGKPVVSSGKVLPGSVGKYLPRGKCQL